MKREDEKMKGSSGRDGDGGVVDKEEKAAGGSQEKGLCIVPPSGC